MVLAYTQALQYPAVLDGTHQHDSVHSDWVGNILDSYPSNKVYHALQMITVMCITLHVHAYNDHGLINCILELELFWGM